MTTKTSTLNGNPAINGNNVTVKENVYDGKTRTTTVNSIKVTGKVFAVKTWIEENDYDKWTPEIAESSNPMPTYNMDTRMTFYNNKEDAMNTIHNEMDGNPNYNYEIMGWVDLVHVLNINKTLKEVVA